MHDAYWLSVWSTSSFSESAYSGRFCECRLPFCGIKSGFKPVSRLARCNDPQLAPTFFDEEGEHHDKDGEEEDRDVCGGWSRKCSFHFDSILLHKFASEQHAGSKHGELKFSCVNYLTPNLHQSNSGQTWWPCCF